MVSSCKMTPWLMVIFCLVTAGCTNVTDQQTSESTHNHQVAILKQIRKLNEDGSYTYGYEAGDGSFKVETRDVLGNIKGTFGFVDAEGEIKRVSYSSSNGTGFKATTLSPLQEHISVVQSIPRVNRTSTTVNIGSTSGSTTSSISSSTTTTTTTKRPTNLVYASTESSTKSSVVQSIPRTRKTGTTSTTSTTSQSTSTESTKNIFNHYLKGNNKSRPRFVINGQQRPMGVEENPEEDEDSQINRPSITEERNSGYRRILFAKRPVEQNLRPITEDFVDKDEDPKISTGNNLRRQLHDDSTKASTSIDNNSNINNNNNDEHSDVYGGALSTTRPLFTTTTPPRVLQRIPGRGLDRPKIFVNRENVGPARFDDGKYDEGPRVYEPEQKSTLEEQTSTQSILIRGPPRVPVENREYLRQTTEPIFVRGQQESYLRELPQRILVQAQQNNIEEEPQAYRQIPIGRLLFRPVTSQQQLYSTTTDANVHYLSDNPTVEPEEESRLTMNQNYVRPRPYTRPLIYQELEARVRPIARPIPPSPIPQNIEDREYQQTTPNYVYRTTPIALPPEPPNPIAPPLSRRDFQMLLRRLLVSQYGVQALSYPKTYLEDALYDQQPYPSYQSGYQTPVPRPEIPTYDQQVTMQYGDRVPLRRPTYNTRGLNPIYQGHQYDDYQDGRFAKRVYRQKFYTREITDEGDEILPAPIREALLLRMLQLAINAERPPAVVGNTVISTTTTPASRYRKTGPVRSVQIITDESDEDKDVMNKKM